jgi:PAS domain S-box-containing protein
MDSQALRVLLIADSPMEFRTIHGYLAHGNGVQIELEHVEPLSAGLARLAEGRLDGVLVDLSLPDSASLATLTRIHDRNPQIPIVVLTGCDAYEFGLQALKAGVDDCLAKADLQPELLVRTICYAIERAAHRRADQECSDRMEVTLRESEQRYRELLAAVTTYTYSVSFLNGAPVATRHTLGCLGPTGYHPEEYAVDPYLWFRMIHPDDRDVVQQYVANILDGKTAPPIEHRILHKNGSVRWIRNTIILRRDEKGVLMGYDGLVEDVSARKEAEEALRERNANLLAAAAIQARLWPKAPPALTGFEIAGASYPAEFAAGDYFDYVPMPDGSVGFVVGDVSGHGLGPAIVMALTYAHMRSLARIYNEPTEILRQLNRFLVDETDRFVTLLFAHLVPDTRSIGWINAGHPPGFILDSKDHIKARLESSSVPLAVLPDPTFSSERAVTLESDDIVLLLTDGVLEAKSSRKDEYGIEKALDVVAANHGRTAGEIVAAIIREVRDFCSPGKPWDDITALVIKVA